MLVKTVSQMFNACQNIGETIQQIDRLSKNIFQVKLY